MSLIKCPECGNEVSDQADACPRCGYPIKKILKKEVVNEKIETDKTEDVIPPNLNTETFKEESQNENELKPPVFNELNFEENSDDKKENKIAKFVKGHKKASIVIGVLLVLLLFGSCSVSGSSSSSSNSSDETELVEENKDVESIVATYPETADHEEGTKIDDTASITVKAYYEDGTSEEVDGWTVENPSELVASQSTTYTISYKGETCDLTIECSTIDEASYKAECGSISYDELARNADSHIGEKVQFQGKIIQALNSDDGTVDFRIEVTQGDYGIWDDVVYVVYQYPEGASKFLEDDIVTFYGLVYGDYTYETVMGNDVTVPLVVAQFIDLNS